MQSVMSDRVYTLRDCNLRSIHTLDRGWLFKSIVRTNKMEEGNEYGRLVFVSSLNKIGQIVVMTILNEAYSNIDTFSLKQLSRKKKSSKDAFLDPLLEDLIRDITITVDFYVKDWLDDEILPQSFVVSDANRCVSRLYRDILKHSDTIVELLRKNNPRSLVRIMKKLFHDPLAIRYFKKYVEKREDIRVLLSKNKLATDKKKEIEKILKDAPERLKEDHSLKAKKDEVDKLRAEVSKSLKKLMDEDKLKKKHINSTLFNDVITFLLDSIFSPLKTYEVLDEKYESILQEKEEILSREGFDKKLKMFGGEDHIFEMMKKQDFKFTLILTSKIEPREVEAEPTDEGPARKKARM